MKHKAIIQRFEEIQLIRRRLGRVEILPNDSLAKSSSSKRKVTAVENSPTRWC